MEDKLEQYIQLLLKILESRKSKIIGTQNNDTELTSEEEDQFNQASEQIFEELIRNPGGVVYIKSNENLERYKTAIDFLYKTYTRDEIWEDLISGGYGGILYDELDVYADNAKKLRPTFVSSKNTNKLFHIYYNEAMRCWLYGLLNSAIIISSSLLENILQERVGKIDQEEILEIYGDTKSLKGVGVSFEKLIDVAELRGLLSKKNNSNANDLRKIRNKVVHRGKYIDSDTAYKLIQQTKDIIEDLFN